MNDSGTEDEDDALARKVAEREKRLAAIRTRTWKYERQENPVFGDDDVAMPEFPAPSPKLTWQNSHHDSADYRQLVESMPKDFEWKGLSGVMTEEERKLFLGSKNQKQQAAQYFNANPAAATASEFDPLSVPYEKSLTAASSAPAATPAVRRKAIVSVAAPASSSSSSSTPSASPGSGAEPKFPRDDDDEDVPITQLVGVRNVVMRGTPAEEAQRTSFALGAGWYNDAAQKRELVAHWRQLKARKY